MIDIDYDPHKIPDWCWDVAGGLELDLCEAERTAIRELVLGLSPVEIRNMLRYPPGAVVCRPAIPFRWGAFACVVGYEGNFVRVGPPAGCDLPPDRMLALAGRRLRPVLPYRGLTTAVIRRFIYEIAAEV